MGCNVLMCNLLINDRKTKRERAARRKQKIRITHDVYLYLSIRVCVML